MQNNSSSSPISLHCFLENVNKFCDGPHKIYFKHKLNQTYCPKTKNPNANRWVANYLSQHGFDLWAFPLVPRDTHLFEKDAWLKFTVPPSCVIGYLLVPSRILPV